MWEDVTVVVACLGFTTALAVAAAELRCMIAQLDDTPGQHPAP